jgi:uncharacterized membrane protein YgcG
MSRRSVLPLLGLAFGLSACNENQAIQHAASPPLLMGQIENRTILSDGAVPAEVDRAVAALGGAQGVHVVLNARDPRLAAQAAAQLRQAGVDPARIRTVVDASSVMLLRAYTVAVPDCSSALRRSWFGDVSNSMTALGQCTQARALAAELSDPGDLVAPAHLQAASGARFGHVVEIWEAGGDSKGDSGSSGGGGGSSGGAQGGAASGGATQTASGGASSTSDTGTAQSGVADNPLLSGAPLSVGARSE